MSSSKERKFEVGDKVRRIKESFNGMKVGDVGTVVEIKYEGVLIKEFNSPAYCHDINNLELVEEEKEMFDMHKNAWFINVNSDEECEAAQKWLFEQGIYWCNGGKDVTNIFARSLTNFVDKNIGINKYGFLWDANQAKPNKNIHEIKLNFKTTVDSVEYPIIETEAQKKLKELEATAKQIQEQIQELKKEI